jgi:outer membrane receptor for ferrienterochelin and colicin
MHPTPNPPLRRALALAAALASLARPAMADPIEPQDLNALPLEQLLTLEIITASRFPQKISEAPSSVSVISADDIRRFGYRSLAEILRSVRGVYVTDDRNYSYVGTRGSGRPGDFNTRLLILVDGMRLNDMVYDQGAVGTEFPIDVSLVERVEFVPGPGSAIYGSSAFFGVVNVITKRGAAQPGSSVGVGAASAATRSVRIASGLARADGIDLLFGAAWLGRKGSDLYFPEYDDAAHNFGVARQLDHDRYQRVFAKASWGGWSASAYAGRRTKGIPTGSYGQQFNDPRSRTVDQYASASAAYQASLGPAMEVHAGVNLRDYRYRGTYINVPDSATVNIDVADSRTLSGELRLLSTAVRQHKIIAGAEYANDTERLMRNHDLAPYTSYLDSDHPRQRAAVYLQDEWRLGERVIVNAGLRHDHDAEGGGTSNPRIALIYKAATHSTLKALYGTAYRSPNANERYYATSTGFKLNPALKPEHIKTYELIGEYFPSENFRASASLFQYRFTDLIALATDPLDGRLVQSNIDSARSKGAEFEAEWLREDGSSLKTSLSLQYAHNGGSGEWLSNSPRQLVKLNYARPLWRDALRLALEGQFTSRRRTAAGGQVGGFGLLNLTVLGQPFGKHIELSASIYNLLDKRYADSASEEHYDSGTPARYLNAIGQDGRTWRIQASTSFR